MTNMGWVAESARRWFTGGAISLALVAGVVEAFRISTATFLWWLMWFLSCAVVLARTTPDDGRRRFKQAFLIGFSAHLVEGASLVVATTLLGRLDVDDRVAVLIMAFCGALLGGLLLSVLAGLVSELDRTNWKQIILLSGFGLVLSHPSTFGFLVNLAGASGAALVILAVMVSCVIQVSGSPASGWPSFTNPKLPMDYQGFLVGAIGGAIALAQPLLLYSQDEATRSGKPFPSGVITTLALTITIPVAAIVTGFPLAIAAQFARRIRARATGVR